MILQKMGAVNGPEWSREELKAAIKLTLQSVKCDDIAFHINATFNNNRTGNSVQAKLSNQGYKTRNT